ncbi:hypothetical protein Tco_1306140, partial [Tanacetum coccineum]
VSDDELEAPEEAPQFPEQAPLSPNYVPGLEHPPSPDYVPGTEHPPSPDYVPGPEYPKYLVPSDDEAPIKDQPLLADASPTVVSPGYVADSNPSEEDPEEAPAEYPADRGDDDDDDDDKDKDEEASEEDKEEEKHLASADFTTLLVVDPVPSTKDTEAFEIDESTPTSPSPRLRTHVAVVAELPSSSPPTSPLTPLSSPLPQIPSRPLPLLSPPTLTSPSYAEAPLGYIVAMIQWRAASPPTHHPSEILLPPLFEVGESSSAGAARQTGHTLAHRVDYGFIDTVDASIRAFQSRAMTAVGEDDRALLRAQVSLLTRERRYFRSMASSYEREASNARPALRQRIRDKDKLTSHIQHEHDRFRELVRTAKAGPQDGPVDKIPPKKTVATTTPMTDAAIKALIAQGVATTLVEYEANRGSGNGDDSHDSGSSRRTEQAARDNCTVACQIKFATCTLLGNALTWWNSYVKTVGHDAAYGTPWLKLALMCSRMFPEESDEVEKYVGGLLNMIHGCMMDSKPKIMQDTIKFATESMDQKIRTFADCQAENKRKLDDNSRSN